MMKNILAAAVLLTAADALAAPDLSRFTIGVNEAGYEPDAPKWCVATNPPTLDYVIQTIGTNIHWRTVRRGRFVPSGRGDGICYGDFSSLTEPGDYRILCGDEAFNVGCAMGGLPDGFKGVASFHFIVKDGVYDTLERMLLTYITWQRCGHRKGWAGLCHQDPVPVKDADGRVVRTIDARGGYHQSNDLRCWHDGISMSLYSLLRYAELRRPLWDEGEIAAELRWGCDYFLRVIAPEGYVYDAQFAPIGWGPFDYYLAPATLGAQCNIVMLLARASRHFREDGEYAGRLLAAAKRIDAQIETNPFFAERRPAPAKGLPAGAQPAERCYYQQWRTSANGLAERCGAALELYRATGDGAYAKLAKACGDELIARQIVEGGDAGRFRLEPGKDDFAFRDFGYCHCVSGYRMPLELFREFGGEAYRTAALRIADWYVRDAAAKGFGPPHPKRSSTTGAARAIYLCECARLFDRPDDRVVASRLFGWLFGANPDQLSNVECVGCHHWPRPVFGQFFPSTPQIPGGMLHVGGGEYDMPAVAQTLWACAAIAGPQADSPDGTFRLIDSAAREGYTLRTYEFYPERQLAVKALVLVPDGAKDASAAIFLPEDATSVECLAGETDPYASPDPDGGRRAYFAAKAGQVAVALARPAMANAAPDDVCSADSHKKYLALLPDSGWTDEKLVAREFELCRAFLATLPQVDAARIAVNPKVERPEDCAPVPPKTTGRVLATGKRMMTAADYEPERADGRTAKTMTWAMLKLREANPPEEPAFLKDRESFLAWQKEFLAPYRKDLEDVPDDPEFRLLKEEKRDGYTLKTFEFYPYEGLAMRTMILYPDGAQPGKTPVVVCMPGGGGSLECLAGEKDPYYNRYPIRNKQCWFFAKCGMIAVALTNHSTANYCADDWSLWSSIDRTLDYWKKAGFRRESLINRSVAMCINFLKRDARVDPSRIACSGLSRGASIIHAALANPDVAALNYNDFVLDALDRRLSTTVLPSGVTYGGGKGSVALWLAMAPKPMILNEGGQYRGVIDLIRRAYELTGHPENLKIHWYDRYRRPDQRPHDGELLRTVTGLTAEEHFKYCNVDAYDHAFHPESALPWLRGLFFGEETIPESVMPEVYRAMAEREKSGPDLFPPDGQTGRKANGPKTKFTDEDLKPERPDGRTDRTTTWAKMLYDRRNRK